MLETLLLHRKKPIPQIFWISLIGKLVTSATSGESSDTDRKIEENIVESGTWMRALSPSPLHFCWMSHSVILSEQALLLGLLSAPSHQN